MGLCELPARESNNNLRLRRFSVRILYLWENYDFFLDKNLYDLVSLSLMKEVCTCGSSTFSFQRMECLGLSKISHTKRMSKRALLFAW